MDRWKKEQLDNEDPGDIALQLFRKQQELSKASSWRAETATAMAIARDKLSDFEKVYSEASREERWLDEECRELAKYLKERVGDV